MNLKKNIVPPQTILRKALRPTLIDGKKIKRFDGNGLPKGVIKDNVYDHTIRLYESACGLNLQNSNKEYLIQMLLIHDLPEIRNSIDSSRYSDITSPQKYENKNLTASIEKKEFEVAKKIFTKHELELYQSFEESGKFLRGDNYNGVHISQIGILAQVMDKVDANNILHNELYSWVHSKKFNPEKITNDKSVMFTFKQYVIFRRNLLKLDGEIASEALRLLDNQMEDIFGLWFNEA